MSLDKLPKGSPKPPGGTGSKGVPSAGICSHIFNLTNRKLSLLGAPARFDVCRH